METPEFLAAGKKVPVFSLPDQSGNIVSSKDLKGKRYILFFYPNDDSETCTKEVCNLRDNYGALKKAGYLLFGISHAPVSSKKKFADKFKLPYPLLADEGYNISDKFGVYGEKLFMGRTITTIHRVTFIVNEKGIIDRVIYPVKSGQAAAQILASEP